MNLLKRITYMTLGALVVLALVVAAAVTFAQDNGDATSVPEIQQEEESGDEVAPAPNRMWPRHRTPGWIGGRMGNDEQLAQALGISVEELQAARQEAREAAIERAVAEGLITQEQADRLLENDFGGRGLRFGPDHDTFLAEALGISVDELQATRETAREEAITARLEEMVADGVITQEQADLMLAQHAVQEYLDIAAALQAAYEEAVAQALADGAITQEQADQLLSSDRPFGLRGFGDGFRGHERRGFKGFGPFTPAPDQTPGTTDDSSGA